MSFVERQRISRYQQTRLHYSCNRNKKAPISTGWVRGQSLTTAVCKRRDVTRAWRETFVLTFLSWQNAAVSEKTNNRGIREMRSSDVSTDDQWPYTETFLKRLCCVESVECHAWSVIRTGASLISTQWAHNSELSEERFRCDQETEQCARPSQARAEERPSVSQLPSVARGK